MMTVNDNVSKGTVQFWQILPILPENEEKQPFMKKFQ